MTTLQNKIDFGVVFRVKNANPNGDPLNGNRPRADYDAHGEVTDVCLKRKARDRLLEKGYAIFVQSDDRKVDDAKSLRAVSPSSLSSFFLPFLSDLKAKSCPKARTSNHLLLHAHCVRTPLAIFSIFSVHTFGDLGAYDFNWLYTESRLHSDRPAYSNGNAASQFGCLA